MRTKRPFGFTLIELMIVVAVVAVLAIIAVPGYMEQIRKGKRAEAIRAIGDITLREERWRADHPTYGNLDDLTGSAANSTSFNNALQYYSISIASNDATGYVVTATRKGDLSNDPKCGNFVLTQAIVAPATVASAVKSVTSGDKAYCWRE